MDQSFHYLLMAAHSLLHRRVMAELSQAELTSGQPKVLDYLGLHDGSAQKAVAAGCQIDPATLTGLLARMEEKGLIRRGTREGDRRTQYVYLTELGRRRLEQVQQTFSRLEAEVLSGLDESQRQALIQSLRTVCESMIDTEVLQ